MLDLFCSTINPPEGDSRSYVSGLVVVMIFMYWVKIVSKASSLWIMAPNTSGFCVDGVAIEMPIPDPGRTDKTLYFWISVMSTSLMTLFFFEDPDLELELSKHR